MLQRLSKPFLLFFLFFSSLVFSEAIVNIEDLRRDGEKGFYANLSGSLSFSRGNRNRDSFSLQSSFDYNVDDFETLYEDEEDVAAISDNTIRVSSYVHNEFPIAENIIFDISAFLQPSTDSLSDYKATLIGQFEFLVNKSFKISIQYNTYYDSKPPNGAVKKEEGLATIFSYNFN